MEGLLAIRFGQAGTLIVNVNWLLTCVCVCVPDSGTRTLYG